MEMLWRRRESLILNLQTNNDDEAAKKTTQKYIFAIRLLLSDSDHSLISFYVLMCQQGWLPDPIVNSRST